MPIPLPTVAVAENIEAEAAFLGAVMRENALLDRLDVPLDENDFFEPIHARIFAEIGRLREAGSVANPITLRPSFEADEALAVLGGVGYLAALTGDGTADLAPDAFAGLIAEMADRRRRAAWLAAEMTACADLARPLDVEPSTPPPIRSRRTEPFSTLDLSALARTDPQPKQFVLPHLAPAGEVTLFTGAGAVGKSLLAQQLATACAAGIATLGLDLQQAPAIYLTAEDDAAQLHWRQHHICHALRVEMASLAGELHLISRRGEADNAIAIADGSGRVTATPTFARVAALIRSTRARLVFLDNVAHLFAGNENDRGEVTAFVNLLNRLAGETGAAIVLLGHPNKAGSTYSGSTAWLNAVRSQVVMERPADAEHDPDVRAVTSAKPNYGRAGEVFRCRWLDWAFARDEDLPTCIRAEIAEVSAANSENSAFFRCLAQRTAERRHVSEKVGANYAPKVFAAMPEAKGIGKDRLIAAMDRLFRIGAIERGFLWRDTAEGKDIFGLRESGNVTGNAPETRSANDRKPAEINRKIHPLYTTYIEGAPLGAAAPSEITEGASA